MFRRRPFRRPPGLRRSSLGAPRRPVGARMREALARAHGALEGGDAAEAARIYHRLAQGLERENMPVRAAAMIMQAAHAEALGGNARQAADHARRALTFLAHAPLPERVVATTERLVSALRQGGHETEAAEVERALEDALQEAGSSRREVAARFESARAGRRRKLPGKCPSCGGPMLPDEVDWHGPSTAECPYCGSAVNAE